MTEYYKIFTNDFRSPIQGGKPIFNGVVPCVLPEVPLDQSPRKCGKGWNFCQSAHTTFRVAGLWPDGWPSRLYRVKPIGEIITRGDKCRAAQIKILEQIVDVEPYVLRLSEPFGKHAEKMCKHQMMWRKALSRPFRDEKLVEEGLARTLETRDLQWVLKRFSDVFAVRTSRALWEVKNAWDAQGAWIPGDTRSAWAIRASMDAWATGDAIAAKNAWAARNIWAAGAAGDAGAALSTFYAATMGWIDRPPELLTIGIREAYFNGLGIVMPTGPNELGWAMVD
jgi:hypothetical protein